MNTHNDLVIDLAVKKHVNAPEEILVMEDCGFLASEEHALMAFDSKVDEKVRAGKVWERLLLNPLTGKEEYQSLLRLYQMYAAEKISRLFR